MVTAASFTVAMGGEQSKCPSVDEWVNKNVVYTYNGILLSFKKRKETLKYATTWMNFEDIMLSEISQSQTSDSTYLWYLA